MSDQELEIQTGISVSVETQKTKTGTLTAWETETTTLASTSVSTENTPSTSIPTDATPSTSVPTDATPSTSVPTETWTSSTESGRGASTVGYKSGCGCGRVVSRLVAKEKLTSAVYVFRKKKKRLYGHVLSTLQNRFIDIKLSFSATPSLEPMSFQISTTMCMGVFVVVKSLYSSCLEGGKSKKRVIDVSGLSDAIEHVLLDQRLKRVLYLASRDEDSPKMSRELWSLNLADMKVDHQARGLKGTKLLKVKVYVTMMTLYEAGHIVYWYNQMSSNIYKYDYVARGKPTPVMKSIPPALSFMAIGPKTEKMAACFYGEALKVFLLRTQKSKSLQIQCSTVCQAGIFWYAVEENGLNVRLYAVDGGHLVKKFKLPKQVNSMTHG